MIFGAWASKYFEHGYNVIPLRVRSKIPALSQWQEWCTVRLHSFQVDSWAETYKHGNIGIPLGPAGGLVALDFDHDVDGLHAKIETIAGPSPCRKTGAKGFTSFYRFSGEHNKKWGKEGIKGHIVELLSIGTQTVLPPSIHPDTGEPYCWLTVDGLSDLTPSDLPRLPADFIEKVDALLGYEIRLRSCQGAGDAPTLDKVRDALEYIPSDQYSTWIEVGMALHHSYGDEGMAIWDTWSAKAHNYDASLIAKKWASFGRPRENPVTAATILHYAIGYGWMPPVDPDLDEKIANIIVPARAEKKTVESGVFPPHLLDAPGLPGSIAHWMDSTAIRHQPVLSLAASLCATGTLMAHRFRSMTDLRTNIMAVGVAPSGGGKEHARQCIGALFDACGAAGHLLGKFASDTGLVNALARVGGIGMALPDEFGRELKAISKGKTASHEYRILTTYMELFSQARGIYLGKEYANHDGAMGRKDINQPCLCIYATTVPKRFYDALSSDEAIDGFLARWLIFEGEYALEKSGSGTVLSPPGDLIDKARLILARPTNVKETPRLGEIYPAVVPFTEGAVDRLGNLMKLAEEERKKELDANSGYDAIWIRAKEHAVKLALVAHTDDEINVTVMTWACELAEHLMRRNITLARQNIADSDYEALYKRLRQTIDNAGEKGVSSRRIAQNFSYVEARKRNEVLAHLVESGMIEAREIKKPSGQSLRMFFPVS